MAEQGRTGSSSSGQMHRPQTEQVDVQRSSTVHTPTVSDPIAEIKKHLEVVAKEAMTLPNSPELADFLLHVGNAQRQLTNVVSSSEVSSSADSED